MIEVKNINKAYFGDPVLEDISFTAETGQVCGLIGYNGAGKTTLLKIIAGIYRPESGSVLIDDFPIYENAKIKSQTFLLSEDIYFLPGASLYDMRNHYIGYYPSWDDEVFSSLCNAFRLDAKQKISSFSKGMKRQAGIILAFSTRPMFLLLDEIFDGLDLAMRRVMKTLLFDYVKQTKATVIVTSHNLRELEDNIDKIVMIKDNKIAYVGTVSEIKETHGTLEEYFLGEKDIDETSFQNIFNEMEVQI